MITVQYESIVIGAGAAGSTATYGVVSVSHSFAELPGYGGSMSGVFRTSSPKRGS